MTLGEFQRTAEEALAALYEPQERRAILRRWLGDRLGLAAHALVMAQTDVIAENLGKQLQADLARLLAHEPIQYVLGWEDFAGLRLKVAPGVLIPRPETEALVALALRLSLPQTDAVRVLDLGTGSGCIALAMAQARPAWQVMGVDISLEALTIARQNADNLGLENAHFRMLDLLRATPNDVLEVAGGPPSLLVSNPPYVPIAEAPTLAAHVRDYEPHLALFAPDEDPLVFYHKILGLVPALLPVGWVVLETHSPLAEATVKLAEAAGLQKIKLVNDPFDRPRFVLGQKPEAQASGV